MYTLPDLSAERPVSAAARQRRSLQPVISPLARYASPRLDRDPYWQRDGKKSLLLMQLGTGAAA
jgi:hypothetical protein